MPPKTDTADPIDLDRLEQLGAVRFGRAVARVVLVYDDGGRVSMDLPRKPVPPSADDGPDLTPTQRDVLAVLRESPTRLTRKKVAIRLGQKDATGRVGQAIRGLLEDGIIEELAGELTDDANKVPFAG